MTRGTDRVRGRNDLPNDEVPIVSALAEAVLAPVFGSRTLFEHATRQRRGRAGELTFRAAASF